MLIYIKNILKEYYTSGQMTVILKKPHCNHSLCKKSKNHPKTNTSHEK